MNKLRIIFAGGGTGGHLFPAIAIANKLKEMIEPSGTADFRFVGTKKGIEYRMRDKLGYPLSLITIRGISRKGLLSNLLFPFMLIISIVQSIFILLRYRPHIIVGSGGYVMGPVIMAAIAMYRRTVIQEQNSYPGLTTRKLSEKVDRLFLGFADAKKHLPILAETMITGNPVKSTIGNISKASARRDFGFDDDDKVILIIGGSQGASSINQNIINNIDSLPEGVKLLWQTGQLNYTEIKTALGDNTGGHHVFAFTNEIEKAYACADIAIARAGALTLAELEASGLPAVLIPYPYAAENHQFKNAESFAKDGSAVIVEDRELAEYNIPAYAADLLESGKIESMKMAIEKKKADRETPAVDMIAAEILKIIDWEGNLS